MESPSHYEPADSHVSVDMEDKRDSKMIFGLIGYPLGHSFSQAFFTEKFLREGIDAEYRLWSLPTLDSLDALKETEGLRGFNVTIPHKTRVMRFLDDVDSTAQAIGAVNVVKAVGEVNGTKLLKGFNTDAPGFLLSLLNMEGFDVGNHHRALVFGTGGASKAVVYALRKVGIDSTLVSRTPGKNAIGYADLDAKIMGEHSIIVNCTPLGTFPDVEEAPPIPYNLVDRHRFCHDLVYNPSATLFMKRCAERGATVKNGAEMLRNQALEAWKIWTQTES